MIEAARMIKVRVGENTQHISKKVALIKKLLDKALHGDLNAARLCFHLLGQAETTNPQVVSEAPLGEAEMANPERAG